jgi:hypothetical protein
MLSLRARRVVGRLGLAALLFAQAAYAIATCGIAEGRGAAAAFAEASQTCHEPETSVNLCLSHCLSGDQSLDKPLPAVPAVADLPVLIVEAAREAGIRLAITRERPKPAVGPPPRILLHSFLI